MTAPATGRGVAKVSPREALKSELARFAPSYEHMLPRGYRPDRLITGAMLATVRNPDLLKCTPLSVAVSLGQVAQLGLDVGITAHLVPFGNTCTFVADYKGYIELMCRAGARKVEAYVVRQGDTFEYGLGLEPYLRHQPMGDSSKPITHGYAIASLRSGDKVFEVVTIAEVDAIRQKHSKAWKGGQAAEWYVRKTAVRRLWKYVPKTPALEALVQHDEGTDPTARRLIQQQLAPETVDMETGEVLGGEDVTDQPEEGGDARD